MSVGFRTIEELKKMSVTFRTIEEIYKMSVGVRTIEITVLMCVTLFQALGDIEIAIKMLKEGNYDENPVDRHYHAMKCDLETLQNTSDEFKV